MIIVFLGIRVKSIDNGIFKIDRFLLTGKKIIVRDLLDLIAWAVHRGFPFTVISPLQCDGKHSLRL